MVDIKQGAVPVFLSSVVALACGMALMSQGWAGETGPQDAQQPAPAHNAAQAAQAAMDPMDHMAHMAQMDHAHHAYQAQGIKRSMADYRLPDVKLVRDDGKQVSLAAEVDDGRPVVLTFVYTTCTTICPVVSQTFAQIQQAFDSEHNKVHLVSISIDPEQDTPARLRAYAQRYGAHPNWQHYTGTLAASVEAQRAFDVYRGDKMNHNPVTFVRVGPGHPWLRIEGFATASEVLGDYHRMAKS